MEEVHAQLSRVNRLISQASNIAAFFRAPVFLQELDEVNSKLTQLDTIFRVIGMLGTLIKSQRTEARIAVLSIASACLSVLDNPEKQNQIYQELESRLQYYSSSSPTVQSIEQQADFAFAMGRMDFEISIGAVVQTQLDSETIKRAARYFRKACALGKKEAYRYLGDITYDGYDGEGCFQTAAEISKEGVAQNDLPLQFRLAMCYEFDKFSPLLLYDFALTAGI